jgi:hypothetical protein
MDIAIEVQGEVVDSNFQNYEVCTLSLYRGRSQDLITSRTVVGETFSEWFTVGNVRQGISFGVGCEGTDAQYRSQPFGSTELNPANLGTIELARP